MSKNGNGSVGETAPRSRNMRGVLTALLEGQRLTQQQLVETTGLSRVTVAKIISQLERQQIVEEHPRKEGKGKPPKVLSIRPNAGAALSIDFGKSHVRVALRNLGASPAEDGIQEESIDVPNKALESLDLAVEMAKRALEGKTSRDLVGICIGLPAPVDREHGRVAVPAVMPSWQKMQPAEELRTRLLWDVPIFLENDANLGAIAEHEWGVGKGYENFVYVKWAVGIGGGLIIGDELAGGGEGLAGEIGHLPLPGSKNAKGCDCCNREDCLEANVGGNALAKRAGVSNLRELVEKARDGGSDPICREVLDQGAEDLGRALGPVISVLNPELLAIGGAFSRQKGDYNLIGNGLRRGLERTALPAALETLRLDIGKLTGRAAALGGVSMVLSERLRDFLVSRI